MSAMQKQLRKRALARALNFGLCLGLVGFSFEARAIPMQDEDDKEPPEVSIVSPKDGAEAPMGGPLFIRVKATDNVIIKKVHLHMNGTDVGSIDGSADVIYSFQVKDIQKGEYTIKAVAYDLAGNSTSSDEITITGVKAKPKKDKEKDEKSKDKSKDSEGDEGEKSEDKPKDKEKDEESKDKSNSSEGEEGDKEEGNSKEGEKEEGKEDGEKDKKSDKGEKSEGKEDKEDKGSQEPKSDKDKKGSSTQQGEDGEGSDKGGCNLGSKDLPWWASLGFVMLGASWRRRKR